MQLYVGFEGFPLSKYIVRVGIVTTHVVRLVRSDHTPYV